MERTNTLHKVSFATLLFVATLVVANVALADWAAPVSNAPTCVAGNAGCDAPLNVGAVSQSKAGGLILNTSAGTYGLLVSAGRVGIAMGAGFPSYPLDVSGDVNITGSYRVNGVALSLGGTAAGGTGAVQFANGTAFAGDATNLYWNDATNRLGIGQVPTTYSLEVNGTIQAAAFIYSSDRKLKSNIAPIVSALDSVRKLQGVSFDWKEGGTNNLGLIAQDVQLVYPQLVSKNESTGMLSVAYGNLVAPIIEAIKELASRSDSQAAALSALEEKVATQEKEIESLKAAVEALKK